MSRNRKFNHLTSIALLAACAMLVPALAAERQEKVFKITGTPSVSVKNVTGNIEVRTWSQREVKVEAVRSAEQIQVEMSQLGDTIRITTRMPDQGFSFWGRNGGSVDYFVTMPAEGNLEANCVSGRISVKALRGELNVGSVSGDLDLEDVGNRLWAKSVSGDIAIARGQVDVEAKTVSGDVTLSDLQGRMTAASVSGDIRLQRVRSGRVTVETTSGDVEIDSELDKGSTYRINSHSGYVNLILARNASFEVTARTFSGDLQTDLPLTAGTPESGRRHGRILRGRVGTGEAIIELETFSGDIRLVAK